MIIEYKNNEGYIYAYISWNIIDADNKLIDGGETVAINGTWVHPNYRHLGVLKKMIKDLFYHPTTQKSLYVLNGRGKYPERNNKLTPIMRYFKYVKGVDYATRKTGIKNKSNSNSNC